MILEMTEIVRLRNLVRIGIMKYLRNVPKKTYVKPSDSITTFIKKSIQNIVLIRLNR